MALDYIDLANNVNTNYNLMKVPNQQLSPNQKPFPASPGSEWMDNYIVQYDNDANNGDFSLPSVVMVSSPEILRFDNSSPVCGGPNMMAAKLAAYWVSQVTPGSPQYNGIISVSNDASKIRQPIEDWLCSRTSVEVNPPYSKLFEFVENQVKGIIWTVTESTGSSTTSYTVTIT